MKTITEKIEDIGVTTPYDFTDEEFIEEIRKGEAGPFISIDELDRRLEEWKKELNERM